MEDRKTSVVANPIRNLYKNEYEDPRDARYLKTLKLNLNVDKLLKMAIEYGVERASIIQYTGSNVKVTEKNIPYLHNCVKTACEILCLDEIPATYIVEKLKHDQLTMTVGSKHPILLLHESILSKFNHEELMFVIGHEIGHIKSEHCQYEMIESYIELALSHGASYVPVVGSLLSQTVSAGLDFAYYDWSRKSDYTADNAGLLVCRDLKSAITALVKISGYPEEYYDNIDPNDFLEQAQEFVDLEENAYNKLVKFTMASDNDDSWTVLRAKELMLWVQSGEYNRILNRSSTWLKNQLVIKERRTELAKDTLEKRSEMMKKAFDALPKSKDNVDDDESFGAKSLFAKGQKGIRALQDKIDVNAAKWRTNQADDAKEAMLEEMESEKLIKELYVEISEAEIQSQVDETIGDLIRIMQ